MALLAPSVASHHVGIGPTFGVGKWDVMIEDFRRCANLPAVNLIRSESSPLEIVKIAESASLAMRGTLVSDPVKLAIRSPLKFDVEDVGSVSLVQGGDAADLMEATNLRQLLVVEKSDAKTDFHICFEGPCGIASVNKTLSVLIANCFLHVDREALEDGLSLINCEGIVDEEILKEARIFSLAFRYPQSIMAMYFGKTAVSKSRLASLLGGDAREMLNYWQPGRTDLSYKPEYT